MPIQSIQIRNFKSIRDTGELEVKPLNVLIGANGVGKSNFISFFKFLNKLYEQELQLHISKNGRADNFLYFGRKKSDFLGGKITFDNEYRNQFEFQMVPDQSGSLIFSQEYSNFNNSNNNHWNKSKISIPGVQESQLKSSSSFRNNYIRTFLESLRIFHFHDTGFNSRVKQASGANDYAFLHEDGGNIAAFLYRLQQANNKHFKFIEKIIQSIAPFFDRFYLQPDEINPQQIFLRWFEKGSDIMFNAHNLSDGTLRMICLTTLLMQPKLPTTIIIDEPELGLHPFAISKLASMLKSASETSQIIISTQSVNLVNEFQAEDIIVVERNDNQTVFIRQSSEKLKEWLDTYSMGDLWEKNVLGGRPR
ncbi:ATPase [Pedobacter changchengzhani]|uniref:ATPase n=1 Tax=Pedobacter changchengzhani TaxID=2529274 RepID=A0A4R5MQ23_9SPHI|nr:AAA family ATPase [Pedobacter changchengzhani]TDG37818.1 ATPase [Pedobacter changchengzhani]